MNSIVSLSNVVKDYSLGKLVVRALNGVSLEVEEGEFLSIAGPSGSGKTTLLNLVGCVDLPTSGCVKIAGKETGRLNEQQLTTLRLHQIGFIFQSFNLVNVLDVRQNIELPLLLQGDLGHAERRRRIDAMLERVGLTEHVRHRPNELSGGQRQRVAIARALIARPRLVLADEPTANLDSVTGGRILDLMRSVNRSEQATFIFSTHDPRVMSYASRVIQLVDGSLGTTRPEVPGAPGHGAHPEPEP